MSIEKRANKVLEQSRSAADRVESWADFSNSVFGPAGFVAKAFPSEMERQTFLDSQQHKEINGLLLGLMKKFGVAGGATPKELTKSGRFVVRIAKTVHHTLDIEAKREGVSLNQLAATKLSLPLPRATNLVADVVIQAFNSTHDGHSPDWVIIDPNRDELFLKACRNLGLGNPPYSDFQLNHTLMNIRKTSKYKGRLNPGKKSGFKGYDDCAFAAEIAIRTLQRTEGVSLDRALCDPDTRSRFDEIAKRLVSDQTVIKLRAAALNLRKSHRLKPMDLKGGEYDLVSVGPIKRVSLSEIAKMPGTYVFYDQNRPLFAGETDDLHRRIEMHLHGGLPAWLDIAADDDVTLKYSVLPSVTRDSRMKWLSNFINRERPLLNYQAAA